MLVKFTIGTIFSLELFYKQLNEKIDRSKPLSSGYGRRFSSSKGCEFESQYQKLVGNCSH